MDVRFYKVSDVKYPQKYPLKVFAMGGCGKPHSIIPLSYAEEGPCKRTKCCKSALRPWSGAGDVVCVKRAMFNTATTQMQS